MGGRSQRRIVVTDIEAPRAAIPWRQSDGRPVSCEEKLKVLNENLGEVHQVCQDAFEDAVLMGCDEDQVRRVFLAAIEAMRNPHGKR